MEPLKAFGFSVQGKLPKTNELSTSEPKRKIVVGKLIDFTVVQLEETSETYNVDLKSQSVVGLAKYFRKVNNIFLVEKPENRPRTPIHNCFKYRKGAMVGGYINDELLFVIKHYENL